MKRIFFAALLAWMTAALSLSAQTPRHPYLLYTPQRIEQAKQLMKDEPARKAGWEAIKQRADKALEGGNRLDESEYLSLAYLMTGDKRYANKQKAILLDVIKDRAWSSSEMLARKPVWRADLNVSHRCRLAAIAYDAIYNILSRDERKEITQGLYRLGVEPSMGDWLLEPTRIHSLNSMGHNWWTSCACMGGLLALSLQTEVPEAREAAKVLNEYLPEWFDFAGDVLQQKPKSFDRSGGMYESLNYANFGIQEALLFRLAWKNACPGQAQPDIPQLNQVADYFAHVCYPRTGMLYSLNFGDSHKNVSAESSLMLLDALGMKSRTGLWYMAQVQGGQHRDGFFLDRPLGFLYMPSLKQAPDEPDMACSQLFADFGWATMRTSWQKDATMLAVKSGHTWNHSHADANSFILFHKGVDILKDAGNCWYPNPAYRDYFFQSQAHNVVLFNGKGQNREQQYHGSMLPGSLHYLTDAGRLRYVLANGTGPYSDQFSRNFRHFLWMDNVIYIIDDLKTHEYGEFQWLWHPNGTWKKNGTDATVTNGASSVVIRPLYPRLLALSDFVHDYPEDLWWEEVKTPDEDLKGEDSYYSFHLPGKFDRVKGLTAIILKDSASQRELPQTERREGKDWIGLRVTYKSKVTDLYINQLADGRLMHNNSWIEADGWSTDAYLFAVSYPEDGDPARSEDVFVAYGSALRRGETSYFSSLSKLFVAWKAEKGRWNIHIDGQPRMHATFGCPSRPATLQVNGADHPILYERGRLEVRCHK